MRKLSLLSLSILMDMSGETTTLLPKIGNAIANVAPLSLYAKNRVSVYALGCSLVRSLDDTPPVLKSSIADVLERSMLHSNQPKKNCELKGHLWDASRRSPSRFRTYRGAPGNSGDNGRA